MVEAMKKKYYTLNSQYLSYALSFLGMRFFKYDSEDGTIYSFEDTDKFREALTTLCNLKGRYKNY